MLVAVTATAVLPAGLASANLITNGSFEQDAVGSTTITGFAQQSNIDAVIVTPAVSDGSQALQLSAATTSSSRGRYGSFVNDFGSGVGVDSTLLTIGQEYRITGDIQQISTEGNSYINVNQEVNGPGGRSFPAIAVVEGEAGVIKSLDETFVYNGGRLRLALQLDGFGGGTGTVTPVARFDNFTLTVVPEPASLALVGAGGLALLGRRRSA
ncbi:hypothetical protein PSMK_05090 [Phycisphaera mikurensis NBRC 102666]|uniref:Ice-binding protein C-terminal domain-containing protein n=1 Tax=Phycisphaera mikurensis (strain NBRC 102666 / KCTC 22515 / FYK2301M01) TaxID=1142394 RepID=I0IBN0_PHYMF|nr:hypothetical protein PSMK_05090 [Phycisphaera mikurensis NBRC 102666]